MTPEETKLIKDTSNNHSRATIIFNDLINKRKKIMNELHESVDKNKLNFKYVGPTKDVSFYKSMDSKGIFNELRDN